MITKYQCGRCGRLTASTGSVYGVVAGNPYVYLRDHGPAGARCVGITVTVATRLPRASAGTGVEPRPSAGADVPPVPGGARNPFTQGKS